MIFAVSALSVRRCQTMKSKPWSVAGDIRQSMERLTRMERKVALVLLTNYPVAGLGTLADLADKSTVSAPTVHRFIGKLGFSGYPDFQQALRTELESQFQSPLTKRIYGEADAAPPDNYLDAFFEAAEGNLRRTLGQISNSEFDAVVNLLCDRRRTIYMFGGRFTDALAEYLYFHLHAIRENVQHIGGQPALWLETLLNLGPRDVILIFDVRRYQDDVIHFAEQAAKRRATVVLLTDTWLSPVTRIAKHVFPVHIEVPSKWDSSAATMVLVDAFIGAVNDKLWPKTRERMERLEELRKSQHEPT